MKTSLTDPMIDEVSLLFGALGDVSRLKILRALLESGEPLSQGTVAECAGLSQANASKHLACLVRVGLVQRHPAGNAVYFAPAQPMVSELCSRVCGFVIEKARTSYQSLK